MGFFTLELEKYFSAFLLSLLIFLHFLMYFKF